MKSTPYDGIAQLYDGWFSDDAATQETVQILHWAGLDAHTPCESILDLGCGTGHLIDMLCGVMRRKQEPE